MTASITHTRVSLLLGLLGAAALLAPPPVRALPQAAGPDSASESATAGLIVGRVLSAETGAPLSSARVTTGGGGGATTSLDGRYVLRDVPAGATEVHVRLLGYGAKSVTGVEVLPGRTTVLDIVLEPAALELEGITVTASAERGSTTSLLAERRTASALSDAIGRDQMERSPDGDAAAALKRVPGLSVVDGKFAYVRGLGERYSATTLNGAPLASPVPDRNVIPLDLFPASLLESVVTAKSYSPEDPGDYAGGLVKLRTRDFPAHDVFSLGVGLGWSSEGTFGTGLGYDSGSRLDVLGFDDGARDLPSAVPADLRVSSTNLPADRLQAIGESFRGDWGPTPRDIPPNANVGLTLGDDLDLGGGRLGFVASAHHASRYEVRHDQIERVFARSAVDDPEVDYRGDITTRSVQWGGLLNLTYQPVPSHVVAFSALYSRLADDVARELRGFNLDSNTDQLNTRLQYVASSMLNLQLRGDHAPSLLGGARLGWRAAYTRASRLEPNTREVLYREFDGTFVFDDFVQSGSVFHQDQDDDGWSAGTTLSVPLEVAGGSWTLAVGASTDRTGRDTYTRRFRFRPDRGGDLSDEDLALPPNELFRPERIGPRAFEIEEATFREDNYTATEEVDAAYAKLDGAVLPGLRLAGGLRVERSRQTVDPRDLFQSGQASVPGAEVDVTDLLPVLNLTWALRRDMNLRASVSRTLARPQIRELAPFSFADYAAGYLVSGNPTLEGSRILNQDVRWEWFPGPRSVLAVSGFHKAFDDPIEVLVLPSTELIRSWVNAPEATNYGVEVEVRTGLGGLMPALDDVELNANLTLVESEVEAGGVSTVYIPGQGPAELATTDRARPLQGQSPYVANLGLTWFDPASGARAAVFFHRFGERIDAVGRESSPDIYEEARTQLDVVLQRPLGDVEVKVSAGRLLGHVVRFTQGEALLRRYDRGRTVSLSLAWSPFGPR